MVPVEAAASPVLVVWQLLEMRLKFETEDDGRVYCCPPVGSATPSTELPAPVAVPDAVPEHTMLSSVNCPACDAPGIASAVNAAMSARTGGG
jgi:hypothetical protein